MKDLPYFSLKQECAKAGLSAKGNRDALIARLEGVEAPSVEAPKVNMPAPQVAPELTPIPLPEPKVTVLVPTQDELNRFLPNAVFTPKIDTSKYAAWLTPERLQELENKLAPIAAGKGRFNFDINHRAGAYQCEFFGGASGDESTTLIDTDAQIVRRAQHYFTARLAKGTNGQSSRV